MPEYRKRRRVGDIYQPDSYAAFAGIGFIATAGIFLRLRRRTASVPALPRQQMAALVEMIGHYVAGGFDKIRAASSATRQIVAILALATYRFCRARQTRQSGTGTEILAPADPWARCCRGNQVSPRSGTARFFDKMARSVRSQPFRDVPPHLVLDHRSALARLGLRHVCRCISDVSRRLDRRVGYMEPGASTPLEAVQGLGIVFGSIFTALIALVLFRCFQGAAPRRENATVPRLALLLVFSSARTLLLTSAAWRFRPSRSPLRDGLNLQAEVDESVCADENADSNREARHCCVFAAHRGSLEAVKKHERD